MAAVSHLTSISSRGISHAPQGELQDFVSADRTRRCDMLYEAAIRGDSQLLKEMNDYIAEQKIIDLPLLSMMMESLLVDLQNEMAFRTCLQCDRLMRPNHFRNLSVDELGNQLMNAANVGSRLILWDILNDGLFDQISDNCFNLALGMAAGKQPHCVRMFLERHHFDIRKHYNGVKRGLEDAVMNGHAQSVAALLEVIPQADRYKEMFRNVPFFLQETPPNKRDLVLAAFRHDPFFESLIEDLLTENPPPSLEHRDPPRASEDSLIGRILNAISERKLYDLIVQMNNPLCERLNNDEMGRLSLALKRVLFERDFLVFKTFIYHPRFPAIFPKRHMQQLVRESNLRVVERFRTEPSPNQLILYKDILAKLDLLDELADSLKT